MTSHRPLSDRPLSLAWFLSFLFLVFSLGGSLAHLYELPHKLSLSAADYLTVQQIYRGWALLGIPIYATMAAMLALVFLLRRRGRSFGLVLAAFLCMVAGQVFFWTFTFPANQATSNWSVLPGDWLALRSDWEWSHAAGAVLNIAAFVALLLSLLGAARARRSDEPDHR